MTTIPLKIYFPHDSTSKVIQFKNTSLVRDICNEIYDRISEKAPRDKGDFGLFCPAQSKWLQSSKTPQFYDLKSGEELVFRCKVRPIKVKLSDGSMKTVLVDESLQVSIIVETICTKLGISDFSEYSLAMDAEADENKDKKKSKPDAPEEEEKWLNAEKTFAEQNVDPSHPFVFKKKFFFSDKNINSNDPVQINLVYTQTLGAILSGKHPCTAQEAVQLAVLQLQIQSGNHDPQKHKPGFLKLKELLPPEYNKRKDLEKIIYIEHSKLTGVNELSAKFRYIQICHSLKTYGVTFFTVKERNAKKKVVTILLGITKERLLKMEVETKQEIQSWPLTNLRRWASTPTSFTLDFGDYAGDYYVVQTQEGEAISQLLAGYIDIILKKRTTPLPNEDEEQAGVVEEMATPGKKLNVELSEIQSKLPGKGGIAQNRSPMVISNPGKKTFAVEAGNRQSFLHHVNSGVAIVKDSMVQLQGPSKVPTMGEDASSLEWRQVTLDCGVQIIHANLATNLASIVSIIRQVCTDSESINFDILGSDIVNISSNLSSINENAPLLSSLLHNSSSSFLDATRAYAKGFSEFFSSVQPTILKQLDNETLITIGETISSKSEEIMECLPKIANSAKKEDIEGAVTRIDEAVDEFVDQFLQLYNSEQVHMGELAEGEEEKAAEECTFNVEQKVDMIHQHQNILAKAAILLRPCSSHLICEESILDCSAVMKHMMLETNEYIEKLAAAKKSMGSLVAHKRGLEKVDNAISRLIQVCKGLENRNGSSLESLFEDLLEIHANILDAYDDKNLLSTSSKEMVHVVTQIVRALEGKVKTCPPQEQEKIRIQCKSIESTGATLSSAIREYSKQPSNVARFNQLRSNLDALEESCDQAIGGRHQMLAHRLSTIGYKTAVCLNQLSRVSKIAAPYNRNQTSQLQLTQVAKKTSDTITNVLSTIYPFVVNSPEANFENPNKLVSCCQSLIPPGTELTNTCGQVLPTLSDSSIQNNIQNYQNKGNDYLHELSTALECLSRCKGTSDVSDLQQRVASILTQINTLEMKSTVEDINTAIERIVANVAALNYQGSQLQKRMLQKKDPIELCRTFTDQLESLSVSAVSVGVAMTAKKLNPKEFQNATVKSVEAAKQLLDCTQQRSSSSGVDQQVSECLSQLKTCMEKMIQQLPVMSQVDKAMGQVDQAMALWDQGSVTGTISTPKKSLESLKAECTKFSSVITKLSNCKGMDIAQQANEANTIFQAMVKLASGCANQTSSPGQLKSLFVQMGSLLKNLMEAQKRGISDPQMKQKVESLSSKLLDSCQTLLDQIGMSNPALASLQKAKQTLEQCIEDQSKVNDSPHSDQTYPAVSKQAEVNLKKWSSVIHSLQLTSTINTKTTSMEGFSNTAIALSTELTKLVLRAAYLVAANDTTSTAGKKGILDAGSVETSIITMKRALETVKAPSLTPEMVMSSAAVIAKQTSALCTSCKKASEMASDPTDSDKFQRLAKGIASSTAAFASAVKAISRAVNPEGKKLCEDTMRLVIESAEELLGFANSKNFAGTPATISPMGKMAQQPLLQGNKALLQSLIDLVDVIMGMASNQGESANASIKQVEFYIKSVEENIQRLQATLLAATPGEKKLKEVKYRISNLLDRIDNVLEQLMAGVSPTMLDEESNDMDIEEMKERMVNDLRAMTSLGEVMTDVNSKNLDVVEVASQLGTSLNELVICGTSVASSISNKELQSQLLNNSKECCTASINVFETRRSFDRGDISQQEFQGVAEVFNNCIRTLRNTIESTSGVQCQEYNKGIELVESLLNTRPIGTFKKKSNDIAEAVMCCRNMLTVAGDIQNKLQEPDALPESATKLTEQYAKFFNQLGSLCLGLDEKESAERLFDSTRQTGGSIVTLLDSMKVASGKPNDDGLRRKVINAVRSVNKDIASVMGVISDSTLGQKAVAMAVEEVDDMMTDLDATVIFADAGQLDPMDPNDRFDTHRNEILALVPKFAEATKSLVNGSASSYRDFGNAAHFAVENLTKLKECIKLAAMSVTSSDRALQKELLQSTKNIMSAMKDLFLKGRNNCETKSKKLDEVKVSAKVLADNLNQLAELSNNVGSETTRGVRSITSLIDEVDHIMEGLGKTPTAGNVLPDEVAALAKKWALCAAELVSAASGGTQDDVIAATTKFKKDVTELSQSGMAAVQLAPEDKKVMMSSALKESLTLSKKLLQAMIPCQQNAANAASKAALHAIAKNVAASIHKILEAASALIPGGYVDPNDPNVIAERELLAAANSIEAAARKMAQLQPPQRVKEADEQLSFNDQIIEAVKAISQATAALLKAAQQAQRHLGSGTQPQDGAGSGTPYFSDGTWSEGLASAAKQVAQGTGDLCDVANMAVEGKIEKERVIAVAKHVSVATTQLITAATSKGIGDDALQIRLKAAGKSVKAAVDNLVKSAEESLLFDTSEEDTRQMMKQGMAGNKIFEIEAQMNIYKMEQELEKARQRLQGIRKNKYQGTLRKHPTSTSQGELN